MASLDQFFDQASEAGDFEGSVPQDEIALSENILGVTFPPTFRRFLGTLGVGDVNNFEYYGLVPGRSISDEDVAPSIGVTLAERGRHGMPEGLVIVGDTGMGQWYVLDCSGVDGDSEGEVKIWEPGIGAFVQPYSQGSHYADFGDFALDMSTQ